MAVSKAFQDRFIDLVDDLEIKQKTKIASTMRITYATFCKIYNYGILPTVPILIRISDFFNVSVEYLIGITDKETFFKSDNPKTFQDRLYELRIENNISTIYKLAECIHIHRNNIAQWNNHNSIPLIEDIEVIADYFNVSIDYLLGRTDDRTID